MRGGSNVQPEAISNAIEYHDPLFTSPESLALAWLLASGATAADSTTTPPPASWLV
jgi:hypothetical protein